MATGGSVCRIGFFFHPDMIDGSASQVSSQQAAVYPKIIGPSRIVAFLEEFT
jgi:hypothetical protein